jgi:2-polyprenyl-3-methyl-5-hydroxy-6-metoxy-1,4-benzoquinol methylase
MKIIDKVCYKYPDSELNCSHRYLLPIILKELDNISQSKKELKIFDLGCGNGSVAFVIANKGWRVIGIDPSSEGISAVKSNTSKVNLYQGSAYDDLPNKYGVFPVVISLEVVEHLYYPRAWASTLYELLEQNGVAIVSTPYHGYFKNLVLALTGKLDHHFTALWDHGHIKFWSKKTLTTLMQEAGFKDIRIKLVGRIPIFAKSMILIAKK